MKTQTRRILDRIVASVALFCTVTQPTYALTLATRPIFLGPNTPPQVMLTMSKDQQLYKKAYNDYSDLDGDGVPELTYKHSVTYYGYFDPVKCYDYDTTNGRFEPKSVVKDTNGNAINAYCSGQWSGNFLNWVSMSRMDAVRKLLYGGLRSTDTSTDTVLERAFVPPDAHSWAKFYQGADLPKLTPFTVATTPVTESLTSLAVKLPSTDSDFTIGFNSKPSFQPGDQLKLVSSTDSTAFMQAPVLSISGNVVVVRVVAANVSGAGKTVSSWTISNMSSTGISFCNLTPGASTARSQSNTAAPQIRVAKGNFALWSANEVKQCQWFEDVSYTQSGFGGVRSNGNIGALSGINASAENPVKSLHGLGIKEYNARVRTCVSTDLFGSETCQQYPSGNFKPVGLLQQFGENNGIWFGLMTGTYTSNTQGGVLRKNIGAFTDEVNFTTDGTFTTAAGIVKTLNNLRIYGYNYGTGTYLAAPPDGDNCNYQLIDIPAGSCTSWGNPMAEVYYEAIRYFAATKANDANTAYAAGAKDTALSLPNPSWTVPLDQSKVCAKLNVLVFNASVSTDEENLAATKYLGAGSTIQALTNAVGDAENITNGSYFIGKRMTDTGGSDFELCTAKTVTGLGNVSGICPEGPTVRGTYLIAGAAREARNKPVRTDISAAGSPDALKVTSYGIQLATNTPQLNIPVPGQAGKFVVVQPIYRLVLGSGFGGGSLVDMKYVDIFNDATTSSGKVYINWEDSEQGGDYDQDMWGTLEWKLTGGKLTITTNAISASSANPQGFGYTVSGTNADGPHFHSGIYGFDFTDPKGVKGCSDCRHPGDPNAKGSSQKGATSVTYNVDLSKTGGTLQDPLWYLAKYGGTDQNGKWDTKTNATGEADKPDGVPDNYFLVTNPLGLETSLRAAFKVIGTTGSASAVAANSTSLNTNSVVYSARFDSNDWTGQLQAFKVDQEKGTVSPNPEWDAARLLPAPTDRVIVTSRIETGIRKAVPFRWPSNLTKLLPTDIGQSLVNALSTVPEDASKKDTYGDERLAYLRGDGSREGTGATAFRQRKTKLGDIANSAPAYVPTVPQDPLIDAGYNTFRQQFLGTTPALTRPPMVYVAANDGMLHGFDASVPGGGKEMLAYIPTKVHGKLNQLTSRSYVHQYYVDGSPAVNDAFVNNAWKTVLVGNLGAGGRGIYALDVTTVPTAGSTAETNFASKVLWEFNVEDDVPKANPTATDPQPYGLGYSLGQPVIRKMANGRWAAIVASGYNNTEATTGKGDGKGYIYIIFLDGPTGADSSGTSGTRWQHGIDYVRLDTGAGTAADPNGVAQPLAVDSDLDGQVDYIYAGDLFGNLWKFDVSVTAGDKTPLVSWTDAKRRAAVFSGGRTQPITSAVAAIFHPTQRGLILTFGTGKYLEDSDRYPASTGSPFTTQSFYGIWDRKQPQGDLSKQVTIARDSSGTFSTLLKQTIVENATSTGVFRTVSGTLQPDWTKQDGWYMDFPDAANTGERDISTPLIISKRLIFSTIVPVSGICDKGGKSYIMIVNPATGGAFSNAVLDTDGSGIVDNSDRVSGAFAIGIQVSDIVTTPAIFSGAGPGTHADTTLVNSDAIGRVAGGLTVLMKNAIWCNSSTSCPNLPFGAGPDSGRATWREVVTQ